MTDSRFEIYRGWEIETSVVSNGSPRPETFIVRVRIGTTRLSRICDAFVCSLEAAHEGSLRIARELVDLAYAEARSQGAGQGGLTDCGEVLGGEGAAGPSQDVEARASSQAKTAVRLEGR